MTIDHSKSYKGYGLRAIGHRFRLRTIFDELVIMGITSNSGTFCDVGCSNGFITQIINEKYFFKSAVGLDHDCENLLIASRLYSDILFGEIDLNRQSKSDKTFDLVTCFETLEHVGNLENSILNILSRIAPGGRCLISVPIEHGVRGFFKYLVKKFLFGYNVKELGISEGDYFKYLISGDRISKARPKANGYGTHFGFDYRDVDDILSASGVNFVARNSGMTRFYRIFG
jgi:2-polyprenyl-3-methyl-5-hydroxy-6-metoxy-1,4-benzoquinol methylase